MLELAPKGEDRQYTASDWGSVDYTIEDYDLVMNTFSGGAYRRLGSLWDVTAEALGDHGHFWHMVPTPLVGERETYGMFDNPEDLYRYTPGEVLESFPSERWRVESFLYFQPVDGRAPYLKGVGDNYAEDYCYTIISGEYDAQD